MKTSLRTLLLLVTMGTALTSTLAHADFLGALKSAASKEFGTPKESTDTTSSASALSSFLPGDLSAFTPANASNAAGILQFCVKNNVLSANGAEKVKNQLFNKLGIKTEEQTNNTDFQDGLKGILHGQGTGDLNLANLGAGTTKLKEQLTEKACDIVLDQAKSFL
jgi:hypothetical protein